jgi:hypothetical protein
MRSLGLVVTAGMLFIPSPVTLCAQHTASPAPAHVAPIVSHVSTPAPSSHVTSTPTTRTPGATSPSSGHAIARANHVPKAPTVKNGEMAKSVTNTKPEKRGLFSLLRRRQPLQADLRTKCKKSQCSINHPIAQNQTVAAAVPVPSEARLGCNVVPVPDPAIPCNVLSPCCP